MFYALNEKDFAALAKFKTAKELLLTAAANPNLVMVIEGIASRMVLTPSLQAIGPEKPAAKKPAKGKAAKVPALKQAFKQYADLGAEILKRAADGAPFRVGTAAEMLGADPAKVSRACGKLEKTGELTSPKKGTFQIPAPVNGKSAETQDEAKGNRFQADEVAG